MEGWRGGGREGGGEGGRGREGEGEGRGEGIEEGSPVWCRDTAAGYASNDSTVYYGFT